MITFALSQVVWSVAFGWRTLTNGDDGIPEVPGTVGWPLTDARHSIISHWRSSASPRCRWSPSYRRLSAARCAAFARASRACRRSASTCGAISRRGFVLSAAFAGVAGALYALRHHFVGPEYLYVIQSAEALIMVILGGAGTLIGPAIGAGLIVFLEDFISSITEHWVLVLGVIYVVVTLFAPGVVGLAKFAASRTMTALMSATCRRISAVCRAVGRVARHCAGRAPGVARPERRRQDNTVSHHLRRRAVRAASRCSTTSRGRRRTGARSSASPAPSRSPICSRGSRCTIAFCLRFTPPVGARLAWFRAMRHARDNAEALLHDWGLAEASPDAPRGLSYGEQRQID